MDTNPKAKKAPKAGANAKTNGRRTEASASRRPKRRLTIDVCFSDDDECLGRTLHMSVTDKSTLVVGLGLKAELTDERVRRAAATAVAFARKLDASDVDVAGNVKKALSKTNKVAFAEGAKLATYTIETYKKTKDETGAISLALNGLGLSKDETAGVNHRIEGVFAARTLINKPANMLTPKALVDQMKKAVSAEPVTVEVIDAAVAKKLGMGAFLAVGTSSGNPPYMLIMRYEGAPKAATRLGLIGKGVTFDTGGYNLKPGASMRDMESDMGGAATMFGAFLAVVKARLALNVVLVIPAVENRISPTSFLPGDILTSMSGQTIEVGNTDAEGRLILADAITYAQTKEKVTHIIDAATLTGAIVAALGHSTTGLMTNNDAFFETFMDAADHAGEQYWRLPVFDEYREMRNSDIADLYNMSKDGCGAIVAGLFLEAFIEENRPWIHLDIAGTAFLKTPCFPYQTKKGTGVGVMTLYRLCEAMQSAS